LEENKRLFGRGNFMRQMRRVSSNEIIKLSAAAAMRIFTMPR
jgi:hypothetical protein